VTALDHLLAGHRHVVPQIVETHLRVRPVRDVGVVGGALLIEVGTVGNHQPHLEPEKPEDLTHPLRVTAGEVVVHRDQVNTAATEGVQVGRQRRDECLSLTGLHFGDAAEVQRHAAHELDVEMTLADRAPRTLAHDGKGLDEQVVQVLALLDSRLELDRLGGELLVAEALHVGLDAVDQRHDRREVLDLLGFARAKDLGEHTHDGPL